jgi:hypothetical protein
MSELLADLLSAAVLVLIPGLVVFHVFRREHERYRVRALAPDAAVARARCAGCGATLAASGLLYVRDGTLACERCRELHGGAGLRRLSASELAGLTSSRDEARRGRG